MNRDSPLLDAQAVQTLGVYLGVALLVFSLIALVAYLTSRSSAARAEQFPRLRPATEPVNNGEPPAPP